MERPKLLLADDSLTIQRVVDLTFAEEGFEVVVAGDGDAAVRQIADRKPDIVLADVHMPGPSGFEICSLLRGVEETADIPVILLVGSFEQFDPEEAERAGADAFVTKPFQSIRQLVDQVRQLLAKKEVAKSTSTAAVVANDAAPLPPEKDTRDIDSLYEQSFAETVEPPANAVTPPFSADDLDDEIIETVYGEASDDQTASSIAEDETYFSETSGTTNELEPEPPPAPPIADEVSASSFEETLQMDAPLELAAVESTAPSVHSAPTEELRRDPFATTTDAFDLDDLDLLDLSTSQIDERYTFGTPTQSIEDGSSKQVVSISPELLDIIVRKVVEKLSEKY